MDPAPGGGSTERRTCGVHTRMILSPVVIYKLLLGNFFFFWYYVLDHMLGTPSFIIASYLGSQVITHIRIPLIPQEQTKKFL